jgi:hypothetical protein
MRFRNGLGILGGVKTQREKESSESKMALEDLSTPNLSIPQFLSTVVKAAGE